MSCPYIIRESIGFGRVREHGYYDPMEMAYDLTHDFKDANVEVVTTPLYNVTMTDGTKLDELDDETVFKMLSAGMPIKFVTNARDGYIVYECPKPKPLSQDELLSRYKVAYLVSKVVPSEETEEHFKVTTRICLESGLTDVNLFFAEASCNDILPRVEKLYNRGLYGLREIEKAARTL